MPRLTVLTEPVPKRRLGWGVKQWRRQTHGRLTGRAAPEGPAYSGHFPVTRSAVEGLKRIGADFNYNPGWVSRVGPVVAVLSDLRALEQAIRWKDAGRIRRLLAGPNLVVLPSDNPDLITAPAIDLYLVNSDWTYQAYGADAPMLKGRLAVW